MLSKAYLASFPKRLRAMLEKIAYSDVQYQYSFKLDNDIDLFLPKSTHDLTYSNKIGMLGPSILHGCRSYTNYLHKDSHQQIK